MQKLHVVGYTTDLKGLILSARRGARSGSYHMALDDRLVEVLEELRRQQEADEPSIEPEAEAEADPAPPTPAESRLPVREVQARLRQGHSVAAVALAAGVEPAWVDRFAPPVVAEQAQVVAKVRGSVLRQVRLGPSALPIGDAVRRNLSERGVLLSPDEFDSAWSSRQLTDGRWSVTFRYRYRQKDQTLTFAVDVADRSGDGAVAADRRSGQLGYVAPAKPPPVPRSASEPTTTGSRSAKERERASEAMHRAAAQRILEAERKAARRAKVQQATVRRQAKDARAEAAPNGAAPTPAPRPPRTQPLRAHQ